MEIQVPRLGCTGQPAHSTLSCKVDEGVVVADKESFAEFAKNEAAKGECNLGIGQLRKS